MEPAGTDAVRWSVKPLPEYGDLRVGRQFAWLPKRLTPNVVVWLETYEVTYQFGYDSWKNLYTKPLLGND